MTRRVPVRFLVIIAIAAGTAQTAAAQCAPGGPPNPAWVKRAVVGIVMDDRHRPIEGADVVIRSPRRETKTNGEGRFQLAELDTGMYEITVRRIGYEIAMQSYQVTDSGGSARFCLVPEPLGLPAMITSARRPGLSGIIGDSTYQPLKGAEVRAVGGGLRVSTDSSGGFYLPLKKGTYPIVVSKPGYGTRMLSVTVPEDSGRQIAVWLGSPERNAMRMAVALDDMRTRILWARPNRLGMMSSEELARFGSNVHAAAMLVGRTRLLDDCPAIIDGGPFTLPLYMIDKDEVALLEVHVRPPPRRTPTSINSRGTGVSAGGGAGAMPEGCGVYVWMKR